MNKLLNLIKNSKSIVILPHDNMDGDAFCSCHSLKILIESFGVKCTVLGEAECIKSLEFLREKCEVFAEDKEYDFDTAIAVDCADNLRFQSRKTVFDNAEHKAVIDHHKTNKGFGDINIINPDAAAACEVIYALYKEWGVEIGERAANLIYCGIVTDTGGFRYSNTTATTLSIAAELLKIGVDTEKINTNIFESKSFAQMSVEAETFKKARFYHGGKTAIAQISAKLQEETGATDEDMNNLSSMLRCIEGVEVSATIKEKDGKQKISMRSKETVDVSEICSHFGGGGHSRAAGATSEMAPSETEEKLVKLIGEQYERRD